VKTSTDEDVVQVAWFREHKSGSINITLVLKLNVKKTQGGLNYVGLF